MMDVLTMPLNRAQRRAVEKELRRPARPPIHQPQPINPLFALSVRSRNTLATTERQSLDALLQHRATADNVAELETVMESTIRAIGVTQKQSLPHLDPSGLADALRVFQRAAWALRRAKQRHAQAGVYGLDAADRAALIHADELVGEMRKPGVILRKTWMAALRESCSSRGIKLPPFEEFEA